MGIFSWKATTKNGFGKYCVNNNACIMTDFYKPILKGGHTHNHLKNAHKRMKHCAICDKPITKYEGFSSRFIGHICMECYIEECREHAVMAGIPTIGSLFDDLRNPYIRRK